MTLTSLLTLLGLSPAHSFSLYFPLGVLALWLVFLPFAYLHKIRIFYSSSLRAVFGEELVFRSVMYGAVMYVWNNPLYAIVISSLLFGIVHMRNLWWAGWRRSWDTSVYAGFWAGPILGIVRFLSGDIYLGIALHFLHNLYVMLPPPGFSHRVARTPRDDELREKAR